MKKSSKNKEGFLKIVLWFHVPFNIFIILSYHSIFNETAETHELLSVSFHHSKVQHCSVSIKMLQKILEKHLWINNNFFENALRRKYDDDSLFLKTFDVTNEITKRNQSYWCDIIKFELNYTDSGNDLK